ncbi:Hsp70 family protein [Phytohabitans kaempferiae]|uniref:Hsp70 family protein n=1 Tax=Phytohabitans kaempferiae TaxID=1620943 RepID=A0ABV6MAE4_9ACTN
MARYFVGIDVGDGESCLAWTSRESSEIHVFRRRNREQSILTAVAFRDSGSTDPNSATHTIDDSKIQVLIGEDAVGTPGTSNFTVNFKRPPTTDPSTLAPVAHFVTALLAEFFNEHPQIRDDCVIYVGHPTGWSVIDVDAYHSSLRGIATDLRLMPESQSALLHARDRAVADTDIDKVLVVDIGSSTIDFTYVQDLEPFNLDCGATFGCRDLDLAMSTKVRNTLRHNKRFAAALQAEDAQDFLLLACRRVKEARFSGAQAQIWDLRQVNNKEFGPIVDKAWSALSTIDMHSLINEPDGWRERFAQELTCVRRKLGTEPSRIILTGGGSRMAFTKDVCREIFPATLVEEDDEPSFSVARGLASNGRHVARLTAFRRDMAALLEETTFVAIIEQAVKDYATSIRRELRKQAIRAQAFPLRALRGRNREALHAAIQPILTEFVPSLAARLADWITDASKEICVRYGLDTQRFAIAFAMPAVVSDDLVRQFRLLAINAQSAWMLNASYYKLATPRIMAGAMTVSGILIADYRIRRAVREACSPEFVTGLIDDVRASLTPQIDAAASSAGRFLHA